MSAGWIAIARILVLVLALALLHVPLGNHMARVEPRRPGETLPDQRRADHGVSAGPGDNGVDPALVADSIRGRTRGLLGEPRVDVLRLNIALETMAL
jgi:hypothetical protein